ncbi:MAG: response regulator [Planctomycetaceae bacterium]|nr:response regulator [Planctomycetaceae bacterium]
MSEQPLRILLVDDDEDTFVLTRGLLSQAGIPHCELSWADSYENGLQEILLGKHDAYLIDFHLGERDGLELIKDAVDRGCRAPLILVTGQDDRNTDLDAMRAGAADYLIKGQIDAAGLERSIRYALQWARREQAESSLKDSEALYISLVESLPVCVLRKDLQGRFIFANKAYCEFTERRLEKILGKSDFDFSPPDVAEKFRQDDAMVIANGEQLRAIEVNSTDGHTSWVEVIKTPVRDARGRIVGTQAIFWDVTERQLALEALERSKEAAEAASRAKSEFLANMSHEIRTPLNAVIGVTELVLDTPLNATQREYLQMVLNSGESLLSVLNDILDFSKIEAGKLNLDRRTFDLRECAGDTMKFMALRARSQDLEIACHIASDVPAAVWGDPNRLRQVLINLVGNAIKFTDAGEVMLDIEVESSDEHNAVLHFAVSDTGIGIPDVKLAAIFEAFEQADTGHTRRFGGTGLGLAICSRLVDLMGGRIWVESTPDVGSTFHFTASFEVADESVRLISPEVISRLSGTRVLVVDDHATNRRIYQEVLSNWGLHPTAVRSASEAMTLLTAADRRGEPFGLILSDVDMPVVDGFEFVRRVKDNPRLASTVIIMSSSADRPFDVLRSEELGVSACLIKPVKQSELFDAIAEGMGLAFAEDAHEHHVTPPEASKLASLRVLLVEDNRVNQKLAVGLLEKWGHQVTIAGNGREAVDTWNPDKFDLVIMDVQMPEMDGLEATREIRKREASLGGHAPIIAMTAHAMTGDKEQCLEAGMDDYVAKPLRMQDLSAAIMRVFAQFGGKPKKKSKPMTKPSQSGLDWKTALKTCADDRELLLELLGIFLAETPRLTQELRAAVLNSDATVARRSAHTIKGQLRIFGTTNASDTSEQIEQLACDNALDKITPLLEPLKVQLDKILQEIQQVVASKDIPVS